MSVQTWQSAIQLLEQRGATPAPNDHVTDIALALEVFCYSKEGRIARRLLEVSGQKIYLTKQNGPGYVSIYFMTSTGFESKTAANLLEAESGEPEAEPEYETAFNVAMTMFQFGPKELFSVEAVIDYIKTKLDEIALSAVD